MGSNSIDVSKSWSDKNNDLNDPENKSLISTYSFNKQQLHQINNL